MSSLAITLVSLPSSPVKVNLAKYWGSPSAASVSYDWRAGRSAKDLSLKLEMGWRVAKQRSGRSTFFSSYSSLVTKAQFPSFLKKWVKPVASGLSGTIDTYFLLSPFSR